MKGFRPYIYLPIVLALVLMAGIYVGINVGNRNAVSTAFLDINTGNRGHNKITQILNYIQAEYVDTVNMDELTDEAIVDLLSGLDPHSSYIPAKDLQAMNEPLEGNFEGIGVEFNIIQDTIVVISPISGGPSEILGIQPGDRIVSIEGETVAGTGITNKDVVDKLRGQKGTKVSIEIFRKGEKELLPFTITRGKIPINSLDVAYMLSDKIGYIKISRFAATTYDEYMAAFMELKRQGMKKMVLDLRGNPGGYLKTASELADEFLPKNKLIVYTEGKSHPKKTYKATARGEFETEDLVILIDEGSASASEIIAGAVQDNDRGVIIGRRSFGKGLVQEQAELEDGSALRLTIARYYTPTGRCIQKPYTDGVDEYYHEYYDRYETGELYEKDSVKVIDSLRFVTPEGKVVYGGGGIMPDFFIPADTSFISPYLNKLARNNLINQFAFDYADNHRDKLQSYGSFEKFDSKFKAAGEIFDDFVEYAENNGVQSDEESIRTSGDYIKKILKAAISRHIWGDDGYYPVLQKDDKAILKALELMESGKSLVSLRTE